MARADARVVAIVQARMSSTRLPGKVLEEIRGQPALALLLERLSRAAQVDELVVATSTDSSDDAVERLVSELRHSVVRGPLEDVLARYRIAAESTECDGVVRITADCPLIDPAVVDRVVARWRHGDEAYVANVFDPRTFPVGQDVEAFSSQALREADAAAKDAYDREHVTPYIRNHPEAFAQAQVSLDPPAGDVRMVLDTAEDLEALRDLVRRAGPAAGLDELLAASS
jgi:spore coat polysaccharide biosynthesis protein SpsF (cytidylyltransferase family)